MGSFGKRRSRKKVSEQREAHTEMQTASSNSGRGLSIRDNWEKSEKKVKKKGKGETVEDLTNRQSIEFWKVTKKIRTGGGRYRGGRKNLR